MNSHKRVVDIIANPVPSLFGVCKGCIVFELQHHIIATVDGLEHAVEFFHPNNKFELVFEINCTKLSVFMRQAGGV